MKLYNQTGNEVLTIDTSKEINRGGEGALFQHPTDKKQVVKIYHQGVVSTINIAFTKELMKLGPEFIKPIELFYTKQGKIAGYSMKYLNVSKLYLLSTFASKPLCQKEGFTEDFKKEVFEKIRISLLSAHKENVVIGDLNPYNMFFSTKGEVYFIDTDSYQTLSKKHSGVMLPDIRDWTTHEINEKTDFYAFDVLAFQSATYVHPYKGMHKKYKTLEERAARKISILSGDKDLIVPGFYQPLTDSNLSNEFYSIFQDGKRFIVNLSSIATTKSQARHAVITMSKDVVMRLISSEVTDFNCSAAYFYYTTNNRLTTLTTCMGKGTYVAQETVGKPDNIYCTSKLPGFVLERGGIYKEAHHPVVLTMRSGVDDIVVQCGDNLVVLDENSSTYMVYTMSSIMNDKVMAKRETIFVPSVQPMDECCIQTISGMKWLLNFDQGYLQTVRTPHDIRGAQRSGGFYMLEIKENNAHNFYLAKRTGLTVELGSKFSTMRSITESGSNVMVADDKRILVYSGLTLSQIAEIECPVVTEQSVLKYCNSGILCLTDDNLFLLNKQ